MAEQTKEVKEVKPMVEIIVRKKKEPGIAHWFFLVVMLFYLAVFMPHIRPFLFAGEAWAETFDNFIRYAVLGMGIFWPFSVGAFDDTDMRSINAAIIAFMVGATGIYWVVSFIGMIIGWFGSSIIIS